MEKIALGLLALCTTCHTTQDTSIWVTLYNSYSGYVQLVTPWFQSWGFTWIHTATPTLFVASTKPAVFTVWNTTGASNTQFIYTTNAQWLTTASLQLNASWEYFEWNTIQWMLDSDGPWIVDIAWYAENRLFTWNQLHLEWQWTTDNGVWLSWYVIQFSMDGTRGQPITLYTSGTTFDANTTWWPIGTYFWRVIAVDYVWNVSYSKPSYFHLWAPSQIRENGGGGFISSLISIVSSNSDTWLNNSNNIVSQANLWKNNQKSSTTKPLDGFDDNENRTIVVQNVNFLDIKNDRKMHQSAWPKPLDSQFRSHLSTLNYWNIGLPEWIPRTWVDIDPGPYKKLMSWPQVNDRQYRWFLRWIIVGIWCTKIYYIKDSK